MILILFYGLENYHTKRKTVKEIEAHNTLILLIKIFTESPRFYITGNAILISRFYFNLNRAYIYREKNDSSC